MSVKVCFRMYAYNSEEYIRKTLDSIMNQSDGSWLLYLINHGSTDGTGKICEEYAQKDTGEAYQICDTPACIYVSVGLPRIQPCGRDHSA